MDSASLAGLPFAAATIGLAIGTAPVAALMARKGRRVGITSGLGLAAVGAAAATLAVAIPSFPLFVAALFIFGIGSAGDRLARYAAADISAPTRRSFAISIVVWAGTIGAVLGPVVLEPAEQAAEAISLEGLAGPPLLSATVLVAATLLVLAGLRPDPLTFASGDNLPRSQRGPVGSMLATPRVRYAVAALVTGQVVMVLIMAMTPLHIRRAGEGLGIVGLVIGAHTFGMFAVSPLTGLLADRFGRLKVMLTGQVILVISAFMAASAGGADRGLLMFALFLLGFGWNLGYVAGSAYLTEGVPVGQRVPLEGLADTAVWSSAAAAGLTSGFLLEATDYTFLSVAAAAMVIVPVAMLVRYGRSLGPAVATGR